MSCEDRDIRLFITNLALASGMKMPQVIDTVIASKAAQKQSASDIDPAAATTLLSELMQQGCYRLLRPGHTNAFGMPSPSAQTGYARLLGYLATQGLLDGTALRAVSTQSELPVATRMLASQLRMRNAAAQATGAAADGSLPAAEGNINLPEAIRNHIALWMETDDAQDCLGVTGTPELLTRYIAETVDAMRADPIVAMQTADVLALATTALPGKRRAWLGGTAQNLALDLDIDAPERGTNEACAWGFVQQLTSSPTLEIYVHMGAWTAARLRPAASPGGYGAAMREKLTAACVREQAMWNTAEAEEQALRHKALACIREDAGMPRIGMRDRGNNDLLAEYGVIAARKMHATVVRQKKAASVLQAGQPLSPGPLCAGAQLLPADVRRWTAAAGFIDASLFSPATKPQIEYSATGRPNFNPETKVIQCSASYADTPQVAHEMLHWVEDTNEAMNAAGTAYRDQRAADRRCTTLLDMTAGRYRVLEEAVRGGFSDPYAGRVYPESLGFTGSEIHTTGIEQLCFDAVAFAMEDPHYFDHLISVLHNADGKYTHPERMQS